MNLRQNEQGALLAQQTTWVRRLARELVGDPALAEDATQEAILAALERPPRSAEDEPGLRAWLRTVVRRKAAELQRDRARQRQREERVARSEAHVEDVVETVGRAEQAHALAALVLELEDPTRTILLLRYQEGLSATRIAERLQLQPAAVRKRISRALATLRARMDHEHDGDRAHWALPLLSWSVPGETSVPAAALLAAVGVVAATVALVAWRPWVPRAGSDERVAAAPAMPAASPREEGATTLAQEEDEVLEGSPSGAPEGTGPAVVPDALGVEEGTLLVRGTVRRDDGTRLPGHSVTLAWGVAGSAAVRATTDAQGRFEVLLTEPATVSPRSPGWNVLARADAPDSREARWRGSGLHLRGADRVEAVDVELVLTAGDAIEGRVVDALDGGGELADVALLDAELAFVRGTRSFPDGTFELPTGGLDPKGDYRVLAVHVSLGLFVSEPFSVLDGASLDLGDLVLAGPRAIHGTVIDRHGNVPRGVLLKADLIGATRRTTSLVGPAREGDGGLSLDLTRADLRTWVERGGPSGGVVLVSDDGSYELRGLAPGTYSLRGPWLTGAPPIGELVRFEPGARFDPRPDFGLPIELVDEDGLPVTSGRFSFTSELDGSGLQDHSGWTALDLEGLGYLPMVGGRVELLLGTRGPGGSARSWTFALDPAVPPEPLRVVFDGE